MRVYIKSLTWHAVTRRIEIEPHFRSSTLCSKMEKCGDFLVPSGLPFPVPLSASRPHHWTQGLGCSSKRNHYVACAVLLLTASQCAQRSSAGFHSHQTERDNRVITALVSLSLCFMFKWVTLVLLRDMILCGHMYIISKCALSLPHRTPAI